MRLLNVEKLEFSPYFVGNDKPFPYVIASHRWLSDEATFRDVRDQQNTDSQGYQKIKAFAEYIQGTMPHIKWMWIDTCCIDKDSAAELSDAINSMFRWYRNAELCIAYLADVESGYPGNFEKSVWFGRGWTLQELLAPRTVLFVTKEWQVIGQKGIPITDERRCSVDMDLGKTITRITGIPEEVLHDYEASHSLTAVDKLDWMEHRETTRPEDMSYALYGILGVTIGANYGEGHGGARQRLMVAIHQQDQITVHKAEEYRKMTDWLSSPDPWSNHESARQQHEPQTGTWLLRDTRYLGWKSGSIRTLWAHGKAGCGKTVLCSTAIEDTRTYCQNAAKNSGHAIFYFSFSDTHKQTHQSLVTSLAVQLCWKEPGQSMLRQAYEKPERSRPSLDELQRILVSSVASYDEVFLHIDALDECPENDGVRESVLTGIEELLDQTPNVRMLVTSRDAPDIRCSMEKLGANPLSIAARTVDADIKKYVSTQLSHGHTLSRLAPATKTLIEDTLPQKSNGMCVAMQSRTMVHTLICRSRAGSDGSIASCSSSKHPDPPGRVQSRQHCSLYQIPLTKLIRACSTVSAKPTVHMQSSFSDGLHTQSHLPAFVSLPRLMSSISIRPTVKLWTALWTSTTEAITRTLSRYSLALSSQKESIVEMSMSVRKSPSLQTTANSKFG